MSIPKLSLRTTWRALTCVLLRWLGRSLGVLAFIILVAWLIAESDFPNIDLRILVLDFPTWKAWLSGFSVSFEPLQVLIALIGAGVSTWASQRFVTQVSTQQVNKEWSTYIVGNANTGGAALNTGGINTGGGNFIGRDQITVIQNSSLTPPERRNRAQLLGNVKSAWITGRLEKSLHGIALIQLSMAERPDEVYHPIDMIAQRPRTAGPATPPRHNHCPRFRKNPAHPPPIGRIRCRQDNHVT